MQWRVQGLGSKGWAIEWLAQESGSMQGRLLRIRTWCLGDVENDDCDSGRVFGYLVRLEWQPMFGGDYQDQVWFNYTGTMPIDWDVTLTKAGWQIAWEAGEHGP